MVQIKYILRDLLCSRYNLSHFYFVVAIFPWQLISIIPASTVTLSCAWWLKGIKITKRLNGSPNFQSNAIIVLSPGGSISLNKTKSSRPVEPKAMGSGSRDFASGALVVVESRAMPIFILSFLEQRVLAKRKTAPYTGHWFRAYTGSAGHCPISQLQDVLGRG